MLIFRKKSWFFGKSKFSIFDFFWCDFFSDIFFQNNFSSRKKTCFWMGFFWSTSPGRGELFSGRFRWFRDDPNTLHWSGGTDDLEFSWIFLDFPGLDFKRDLFSAAPPNPKARFFNEKSAGTFFSPENSFLVSIMH